MVFQNKSAVLRAIYWWHQSTRHTPHDQGWKKNDNDAIVHTGRIIDRFFEKALDQYYSQLSKAGQLYYQKKTKPDVINGKTNKINKILLLKNDKNITKNQ